MIIKKRPSVEIEVLLLLLLLHVFFNCWWVFSNNLPPSWDAAAHTTIALDIATKIRALNFLGILHSSNYYPIFVHTVAAMVILFIGPLFKVIQLVGTLFFGISIIFLYLYALELTNNKRIAIVASILFSFCPIVFSESRRLMLDIPLTAITLVTLFILQKSNHFTKKSWGFLFFVSVGFLVLTKWTGLVFIALPVVFSLVQVIRTKNILKVAKPMIMGSLVALLLTIPWYTANFASLKFLISVNSIGETGDPTRLMSIENVVYYFQKLTNYITTPLMALLLCMGAVSLFFSKTKHRFKILLQIAFGVSVFTLIQNKDPRYLIPLVPFITIVIAIFFERLIVRFKTKGKIATYILIILSGLYYMVLTIRPPFLEGLRLSVELPLIGAVNIVDINDSVVKRVYKEAWPNSSIIAEVAKTSGNIVVLYETEAINPSTLSLYLKAFHMTRGITPNSIITPDPAYLMQEFHSNKFPDFESIEKYLSQATYIVDSPNTTGVQDIKNVYALTQIRNYVEETHHCSKFVNIVSPSGAFCFVREGDLFTSGSDVLINGTLAAKGEKDIVGSVVVSCPWMCSFNMKKTQIPRLQFVLIKQYSLPNGDILNLYKRKTPDNAGGSAI